MRFHNSLSQMIARCGAVVALMLAAPAVFAQMTDLSNSPLASTSTTQVKPNIMYLMDTSGSMDWTYMGDTVGNYPSAVGYKNNACNGVYYNPGIIYLPPVNANGSSFAPISFTAALNDGYATTTTTVNLSTSFKASNETAQPAYYYVYSGTQTLVRAAAPCTDNDTSTATTYPTLTATGGGTWTKVQVTATSGPGGTDERQNFANWYSYYRKRIFMMKAAVSRVFSQLDANYRVGFITINPGSPVNSAYYVPITDFTTTQKSTFFSTLFSQTPANSTPLREALSRVGWYYAGKTNTGLTNGITDDPVQYSCQQNFTILTTDGYWNGNAGQDLNGNAVGNQDGNITIAPRPMYDGATSATAVTQATLTYYTAKGSCPKSKGQSQYQIWYKISTTTTTTPPGTTSSPTTVTSGVATWLPNNSCTTSPAAPPPSETPPGPNAPNVLPTGCSAWPCTSTTTTGGSSDSLSDVAQYYYNTDLRSTMVNNVPSAGTGVQDDQATWQHMTTFTMGLGVPGTLVYRPDYKTATSGDFYDILQGVKNWPIPVADSATALDDLWHAAVDGRGQFFSAGNPDAVISGFNTALAGINARIASAAAAATSNLEPVAGDNFAYTAKYVTSKWTGELEAHQIDLNTGAVLPTVVWSAQAKLDTLVNAACDNRKIYLFRAGATNNLTDFSWNTTNCTSGTVATGLNATEQAYFSSTQIALLSQYPTMTDGTAGTVDQRTPAAGANLVNFLRGQKGNEGFVPDVAGLYYRTRDHVLGDIVDAQPVYVKAPFANYADTGYDVFKTSNASRTPMVYVAANDGMLHAFYAGTSTTDPQGGVEAWAFMPTAVLPNLYRLADNNYASLHRYFVDGTPTVSDVNDNGTWKTILVGGLNAGGQAYYALDITDPLHPKGLWEFKWSSTCYSSGNSATWNADCNLGYTFGNPQISKLADGRWAVFVTSGYNNVNAPSMTGDGQGYLYVLNAMTGQIIYKISTGVGSATTPSGLAKINNWVDNGLIDNTTQRVYGGDLLGNVWRFDVNGTIVNPPNRVATLLATLTAPDGTPQPITTKIELANVGSPPVPFLYVATGRYLGASDIATTQVQSVYAVADPMTATPYGNLRQTLNQMVITDNGSGLTATRTVTCSSPCTSTSGWYADLPDVGERVNVDPKIVQGTLLVGSNVPKSDACTIGGYSWLNYFDYKTGNNIAGMSGMRVSDSLLVGLNVLRLPDGRIVANATSSDASQKTMNPGFNVMGIANKAVGWREIVQ